MGWDPADGIGIPVPWDGIGIPLQNNLENGMGAGSHLKIGFGTGWDGMRCHGIGMG